jgi:hypothetical protein
MFPLILVFSPGGEKKLVREYLKRGRKPPLEV